MIQTNKNTKPEPTAKERLESGCRILENILLRRILTGSPGLGSGIERAIVNRELRELEEDLRRNTAVGTDARVQMPQRLDPDRKRMLFKLPRKWVSPEDAAR